MDERFELIRQPKRVKTQPVTTKDDRDRQGFSWWEENVLHWSAYPNVAIDGLTEREIELLKIKHGQKGKPAKTVNIKRSLFIKQELAKGKSPYQIYLENGTRKGYCKRSVAACCAALTQAKTESLLS